MKEMEKISVLLLTAILALAFNVQEAHAGDTDWHIEIVDSTGPADFDATISITLDSNDDPHISYWGPDMDSLKYAFKYGAGWNIETVDTSSGPGGPYVWSSIALDSNDDPHISYCPGDGCALKYAHKDGGWNIEPLGGPSDIAYYCSIALDSNDNPHISYERCAPLPMVLNYARKDGGWNIETVDSSGQEVGRHTSITLDSNDNPHISYWDRADMEVKYAFKYDGGWNLEVVHDGTGPYESYTSIALDSNDNPHISYYRDFEATYAFKYDGGWNTETVDSTGSVEYPRSGISLSLDSNDNPHISYYHYTNKDLQYAFKYDGGWNIETVDSNGDVGGYCCIALDSNDNPHIIYYDVTNEDLKYAYKTYADGDWWPMFRHDPKHTGRSAVAGAQDNRVKWTFTAGGAIRSSPAIAADGTIYVGSNDANLYAIEPNGALKWSCGIAGTGGVVYSSPAIGSDGTIYVGTRQQDGVFCQGKVYAVDPNGTVKWSFTTDGDVSSSPAIDPNSGVIYVGATCQSPSMGRMYAFEANQPNEPNGTPKWEFSPPSSSGWITASAAIREDGTILFGDYTNPPIFWALNPDGSVLWQRDINNPDGALDIFSSAAIDSNGMIYFGGSVGDSSSRLWARHPNGTSAWDFATGGYVPGSPAIGADGTIYVGSYDDKLYAIDANGTEKWAYVTGGDIYSSPAVGADGTIYVGSNDGNMYAIDPNGTLKWSYTTGGAVYSSPAIGPDGTVYVGSYDGKLYAFGPGPPGADLNGDCYVGVVDLGIFADQWVASDCCEPNWCVGADLDESNDVDWADFDIFAGQWLECIPGCTCIDMDGDGYANPASPCCLFPEPDCNDNDPNVNPGAAEICDDSIDNDCDGLIDCNDPNCYGDPNCDWPACWDCARQCHGDADCLAQGMMQYWVYTWDAAILLAAWDTNYPDPNYDPCADFDRDGNVNSNDSDILETWFSVAGVPPNCPPGGTWPPQP